MNRGFSGDSLFITMLSTGGIYQESNDDKNTVNMSN